VPNSAKRLQSQLNHVAILWEKRYAGLGLNELGELRQLREENTKLRLMADLSLDRHILLQEIVAEKP
jgi:hypothetical protein